MTKIVFETFLGANSRVSPDLLPNGYAVEATNVDTEAGSLAVWKEPREITGVWNGKVGTLSSLYLMDNSRWLAWTGARVDAALMQKASNLDWEILFTGTDKPRYTNRLLAIGGGGHDYPEVSYPVGIPVPTWLLVATVTDRATPANSVRIRYAIYGTAADDKGNRIARSYIYTFVNDSGREGAPSEPSNTVYSNDDEQITLTHLPPVPQADIHKIRVYVAASGGTYNFLKDITIPATSDIITDNEFGDAIETTLYSPPNDKMVGVTAMANGILAGYHGNNLCFSEPYQSHAWPEDYVTAMDYPIKGISAYGNMLYISTEGYPLIATGNSPTYMSFTKLSGVQACLSTASMVSTEEGAMYAAKDGIILIGAGAATLISESVISRRAFNVMNPSSIHAYFYRGKYVGFYKTAYTTNITLETGETFPPYGAFILDPARKTVTFTNVWCDCGYVDNVSGRLYMAKRIGNVNHLYVFDEGTNNLLMSWKTKPIFTAKTHFSVCKVRAERYPFTLKLYADGILKYTKGVATDKAFRLPSGYQATEWAVHVAGDTIINSITLAESMSELK